MCFSSSSKLIPGSQYVSTMNMLWPEHKETDRINSCCSSSFSSRTQSSWSLYNVNNVPVVWVGHLECSERFARGCNVRQVKARPRCQLTQSGSRSAPKGLLPQPLNPATIRVKGKSVGRAWPDWGHTVPAGEVNSTVTGRITLTLEILVHSTPDTSGFLEH